MPREAAHNGDTTPRRRLHRGWIVLAVIALALVIARVYLPIAVRRAIESKARTRCPQCSLAIDDVDISILRGTVTLKGVEYVGDRAARSYTRARAARIFVDAAPLSLLRGTSHIEAVRADGLAVTVYRDRTRAATEYNPRSPVLSLPEMHVERVTVRNGALTIVSQVPGRDGALHFTDVSLDIGPVGTRRGLGPARSDLRAEGTFERSGRASVVANIDPLSERGDGRIELGLRDFALNRLNDYTRPTKGITLGGTVDRARAVMNLRDGRLTGELSASYRGLDIDFADDGHRSGFDAFVRNVGSSLLVNRTQERSVSLSRVRGRQEKLLRFLWDALDDGIKRLVRR